MSYGGNYPIASPHVVGTARSADRVFIVSVLCWFPAVFADAFASRFFSVAAAARRFLRLVGERNVFSRFWSFFESEVAWAVRMSSIFSFFFEACCATAICT